MLRTAMRLALVIGFFLSLVGQVQSQESKRLVVLGFDGLDHARCVELIEKGELPNLKKLGGEGTFRPLQTTNPAISPVSWSALTTGLNPGATGIDGFLRRDFADGEVKIKPSLVDRKVDTSGMNSRNNRRMVIIPIFAIVAFFGLRSWRKHGLSLRVVPFVLLVALVAGAYSVSENSLPDGRPYAENMRAGQAWWEVLDAQGIKTATMLAPCSFPAPDLDTGRLLAGLGVPDALGTFGYWTVFRDDIVREDTTETGGFVKPLIYIDGQLRDGKFEPVAVEGPPNIIKNDGSNITAPLAITLGRKSGVLYITDGIESVQVDLGSWSEPFPINFKMSNFVNVRGFTRFRLLELDDRVRLYLDPISLNPRSLPPGVKLSHPNDYAANLVEELDKAFETVGWACATNALKDRVLDDASFLQDAKRVWEEQENLAMHELAKSDTKVVTCVLTVPDRIQHMFARYDDPNYKGLNGKADPRFRNEIKEVYKRVDSFVGLVRDRYLKEGDELIVVSDHGMSTWKRAVNLNSLLVQAGLLKLKSRIGQRKLDTSMRQGVDMQHIDWANSKAYSVGLGRIYLNLKGREPQGIVEESEVEGLLSQIKTLLMDLKDEGKPVVASAALGRDIYDGDKVPGGRAEIYVGFHRGYRVSWQSCLGGVDEPVVFANTSPWSGDHCSVDPGQVPGVLFSTLKLKSAAPRVVDVAPTIIEWAGGKSTLTGDRNGKSLLN